MPASRDATGRRLDDATEELRREGVAILPTEPEIGPDRSPTVL